MIGVGLGIVLVAGLMLLAFVSMSGGNVKNKRLATTDFNPQLVGVKWAEIKAQMQSPAGLKNSLIEADKLLDYVLKGRGYRGETMAERLKKAESQLRNKEAVWQAHKLRNAMVHEVHYDVVRSQVEQAISALGSAIKDLGGQL